jgi:MinD-like ATPase involved in chromosome partitioning or flagellar assembly
MTMSKIVSVHSYRGGTGKSNLTANLAVAIAAQGRRVGVVDTDIQSPGIHVLFGLAPDKINRTLNDYLFGRCPIQDTLYDVTPPAAAAGRVFLLPSSMSAVEITRVLREGYDVERLSDGFQALFDRLGLDYLFIDSHPGLNEETLLSIAISDVLVLVMRPDRQDFQGTAVTVEVARKLQVARMLLVVNMALPSLDRAALRARVESAFTAPVAAYFTLAEQVMENASGEVFCATHPDHPFSAEVRRLAAQVMA